MSVFVGGCDLEAIEQVCSGGEITIEEVFDLVAGLVDKSVIFRQDHGRRSRYHLLETIREFGSHLLTSSGEQATIREQHWNYYRHLAKSSESEYFSPRQVEWLVRLRSEQPNLRAALEYGLSEPTAAQAGLELAAIPHCLCVSTGALREGCRWLERTLEGNPEPTSVRAKALKGYAFLLIMPGNLDAALASLQECRALGGTTARRRRSCLFSTVGWCVRMYSGDYSNALLLMEEALSGHRELNDPIGIYLDLRYLSMAAGATNDPRTSAFAKECLAICESHGAEQAKSWALWVVGLAHIRRGEAEQGREMLIGGLAGEAHCIEALGWAAGATDDMERAARLFGAAHTMWRKVGSSLVEFGYLQQLRSPFEQRVRNALDDETHQTLFNAGQKLSTAEAINYALQEVAPQPAAAVTHTDTHRSESTLTPREQEVAEFVGQGLSNKEIAGKLTIAQRTAEGHVENILSKFGFTSRTQIAAWVTERTTQSRI